MKHNAHLYIWTITLVIFALLCALGFVAVLSDGPERDCLIYGIDFNGRNEPFGLFCS